jgi:hypothetical protein
MLGSENCPPQGAGDACADDDEEEEEDDEEEVLGCCAGEAAVFLWTVVVAVMLLLFRSSPSLFEPLECFADAVPALDDTTRVRFLRGCGCGCGCDADDMREMMCACVLLCGR